MTVAYDLDGVLCRRIPKSPTPWSRMSGDQRRSWKTYLQAVYRRVPRLIDPEHERFYVISARKETREIRAVTERWLETNFSGRVLGLELLEKGRSIENVVEFKSAALAKHGIEDFYEDNRKVLAGIRPLFNGRLWLVTKSARIVPFEI